MLLFDLQDDTLDGGAKEVLDGGRCDGRKDSEVITLFNLMKNLLCVQGNILTNLLLPMICSDIF